LNECIATSGFETALEARLHCQVALFPFKDTAIAVLEEIFN